jgi:hypothetical protein
VCREALLLGDDHATPELALLLAAPEAMNGDVDAARALVARALPRCRGEHEHFLADLAEAVIAYQAAPDPDGERRGRFNEAMDKLSKAMPMSQMTRALLTHYKEIARRLRASVGT